MEPTRIVAQELARAHCIPGCCETCTDDTHDRIMEFGECNDMDHVAVCVLRRLHDAGWRIVRTSTCACGVADADHVAHLGPGTEPYPVAEHVVEEWAP